MSGNDRRARLIGKFRTVTAERLATLLEGFEKLESRPDNSETCDLVKRELHTLKGEAKMLRFDLAGRVAHSIEESLIEALDNRRFSEVRELLTEGLDLIGELVSTETPDTPEFVSRVDAFCSSSKAPVKQVVQAPSERDERRARLLTKLRHVAKERAEAIEKILAEHPELSKADEEVQKVIKREIHSLKGETRMMKLALAGDVAARTEALIVEGGKGPTLRSAIIEGLRLAVSLVSQEGQLDPSLVVEAEAFVNAEFESVQTLQTTVNPVPPPLPAVAPARSAAPEPASASKPDKEEGASPEADYVRVSSEHVVAMTDVAGELLVRHEQLERSLSDIERITLNVIREVEGMRSPDGVAPRVATIAKVAAFGRELLSTLARANEEQFHNGLQLATLQDEIRSIRMVRIGDLFAAHARSIRQLAREQGKLVRVVLRGEDVTVDKQVLDCLDEPLLHLCRNAVDHGLEAPEIRAAAGKPQRSEIRLSAKEVGGHVEVVVSDDGRGVDPETIRAAALRKGLVNAEEAAQMTEARALELMFRSGFSTRSVATDLSGRGVGLDVVSSQMGELGGSVKVESAVGAGTSFILRSPISTAFTRGLVVKAADSLFAIPSTAVSVVISVEASEVEVSGHGRSIFVEGERLALVSFTELLGGELRAGGLGGMAVIIQGQGKLALLVDEVIGEREAVRRNLNQFVAGAELVSGTGMMEGRRLVMFVNLQELFRLAGAYSAGTVREGQGREFTSTRKSRVLVVDDSELTRDMLVSLLERLSFAVSEAVDGADALLLLERGKPDLVMTDLDMPVMDGFTLLERIRESPTLKDIPVVVLSTRDSDEVKRKAMKLGANAYLVKAAFRADELHRTLKHYIKAVAKEPADA